MMLHRSLDVDQHRMAATDDERDIGLKLREISDGRMVFDPGRIEMGFVMMNAQKWPAQNERQSLCRFESDHKRAGEAGSLGGGDGLQLIGGDVRLVQGRPGDGN